VQRRTIYRIAGIVLAPLLYLFFLGGSGIHDSLEETGKAALIRVGLWAVVLVWLVLSGVAAYVLGQAWPTRDPKTEGIVTLTSFLVLFMVGPLVTWTWLRRHVM
jgi:hypothetical protein